MNQNIWGPHFWITLHTITFSYPINPTQSDKNNFANFINSIQYILPCKICRQNFSRKLKENPIMNYLNSRKDFVYWMIDSHNKVNSETGKRYYSNEEVIKIYEDKYKIKIDLSNNKAIRKDINYKIYVYIILILFIILILLILIFKNKIFN
jgi:hypothetical protein